ncbi:MAG TPA: RNA methyltransferase, partial [Pseudonocardiaceae bacterium]|nr:RNA methyltransferase [Pseudonocardiaceae bacterium]
MSSTHPQPRPGDGPYTERTPRVAAARALLRRHGRAQAGRFLVEGAQAVREALGHGGLVELFATPRAAARHPELLGRAE